MRLSTLRKLYLKLDKNRPRPPLVGVSGHSLTILGMARFTIDIGVEKLMEMWMPVVPDNYLTAEMLLGTDVITESDLTWKAKQRIVEWGKQIYPVALVRTKKNAVSNIQKGGLREIKEQKEQIRKPNTEHLYISRKQFV